EHVGEAGGLRYNVRAVDLPALRLRPGVVAAKGTGPTEQMAGSAVARLTMPDGRWVFTLYATGEGGAFVHALDTVAGRAHCLDLPWKAQGDKIANLQLRLAPGGREVRVTYTGAARTLARIDTRTLRVRAFPHLT